MCAPFLHPNGLIIRVKYGMRTVKLPKGEKVPVLGLGTWYMGESSSDFDTEVKAIRYAIERGIRLIDTAEMYANGGAEKVVGTALKELDDSLKEQLFIVTKVLPTNASFKGVIESCEHSLKRLGLDFIDLYLLHWPSPTPLQETINAFRDLQLSGKIRYFGLSNFSANEMAECYRCNGGEGLATNQILYNLSRRGVEWDLMPECRKRGVPIMAYSPLEQGRLEKSQVLSLLATRHGVKPLQIALAWVLAQENVIAIPKSVRPEHIDQNLETLDITLDSSDYLLLDQTFPRPTGPSPLEIL